MALPASGQISLNEIHVEAGGGTGTACSINDTDIRDLNPQSPASGGAQDFADYHGASAGGTVTLSGEDVVHDTGTGTAIAGIRVNSDGTIDKRVSNSYSQIDSSTDWIIPNGEADSTYDVRITNVSFTSGSSFVISAAAEDVWVALSSNREWSVNDTNSGGAGRTTVSFTLEIRKDGGAVLDSATYSLDANYNNL